jgi:anaerobic nitric oxide reductase transcription regulator
MAYHFMSTFNSNLLIEIALDLANSINNDDRFDRLLDSIRKAIQCDAVVLLGLHENILTPLATQGLSTEVQGRRFLLEEHPRLKIICESTKPMTFPEPCPLPDPYDGLLLAVTGDLPVHSCMGLPLYSDQKLIGLVTIDSLQARAFNNISGKALELIAALSSATLKTALEFKKLEISAQHAHELVQELTEEALLKDGGELIGQSTPMLALKNEIQLVASSDYTVLIMGDTGVGKELVARKVHQMSGLKDKSLVHINCASLTETLAEAELFGHTKGAFTGAEKSRPGKFQLANGGSLFLDEVGELPLSVQSKLLRVLQSGEIQPVGQDHVEHVKVRVIAATNRDLEEEVRKGRFRADLYHRLSVYPLKVPRLNDRGNDALLLAGYFLEKTSRKLGIRQLKLSKDAELALTDYAWPGNVRELEHVISRASLKAKATADKNGIISLDKHFLELPDKSVITSAENTELTTPNEAIQTLDLNEATQTFQRRCIVGAYEQAKGNWSEAARNLNIDRANLMRMAKRLGISVKKTVHT